MDQGDAFPVEEERLIFEQEGVLQPKGVQVDHRSRLNRVRIELQCRKL